MELSLDRTYYNNGTNGVLQNKGHLFCYTIELPWRENGVRVSCIPEGRYKLAKRYSEKFGWHIQLRHVIGRSCILIHPANNALLELEGCIAPVAQLTGQGKGNHSRVVFEALKATIYESLERREPVFITIGSAADKKKEVEPFIYAA